MKLEKVVKTLLELILQEPLSYLYKTSFSGFNAEVASKGILKHFGNLVICCQPQNFVRGRIPFSSVCIK